MKAFFSISGRPRNFQWTGDYIKITNSWYERAIANECTISKFSSGLPAAALVHRQYLNIEPNTGKPNTFTGVDVEDVTGGAYNLTTLLEGNNVICFVYQNAQQVILDILKELFGTTSKP